MDDCTSLVAAAARGALPRVKALLERGRCGRAGTTAALEAVVLHARAEAIEMASAIEIAARLIHAGADVENHDREFETTLLHEAAAGGCLAMVVLLVERGARVDAASLIGTPLSVIADIAAPSDNVKAVARYLLQRGANPNAAPYPGCTPAPRDPASRGHEWLAPLIAKFSTHRTAAAPAAAARA